MAMGSPARRATIQTSSIPAPTGGLNARDSIAEMPPGDAVLMDNFFPEPNDISVRNGYISQSTGFPAWVETVMGYRAATAGKLFGISSGSVYDCTAAGAVGAAVLTGLSNSRWQYVNFATGGGQFLWMVNGTDPAQMFDGTSWTVPSITGVSSSNIINVTAFKSRLWLTEKNSMRMWYLPTSSISGAASVFDLSPLFKLGGFLMGAVTCTIDNAGGIDDYIGFVTSEGEVALYRGTDPANASSFAISGLFRIGRPIGRRFYTKVGADVIMVTADGVTSLSKAFLTDRIQNEDQLTYKIVNLINNDVQSYNANFGWQPVLYPMGNKILINVPQLENSLQYQYVMNTITGSWCRFTGWNAACFEIFADNLYFGGNTVVNRADFGNTDGINSIVSDVQQAFSYFNAPGRQKRFTMARPIFSSDGKINPTLAINLDFSNNFPTGSPTFTSQSGSPWNTSPWNTSPWTSGLQILKDWQTVSGIGFSGGLRMRIISMDVNTKWQSTDFVYEYGGIL